MKVLLVLILALIQVSQVSQVFGVENIELLTTKDFSIPVPKGWRIIDAAVLKDLPANSFGILEKKKNSPNAFIGSVVIIPIDPADPALHPSDKSVCVAAAKEATEPGFLRQTINIVSNQFGKSCQIVTETARKILVMTTIAGSGGAWAVTCGVDPRNQEARNVCTSTLENWKFKPNN